LSRLKENLGLKLTYAFIGVIIVVLAAFTSLAVVHEGTKEKAGLIEQGTLLAGVLSHTSVMGVFAENEALLTAATEGIMNSKEVVSVAIYNANLTMLFTRGKTLSRTQRGTALSAFSH
jgi:hypothetical protein